MKTLHAEVLTRLYFNNSTFEKVRHSTTTVCTRHDAWGDRSTRSVALVIYTPAASLKGNWSDRYLCNGCAPKAALVNNAIEVLAADKQKPPKALSRHDYHYQVDQIVLNCINQSRSALAIRGLVSLLEDEYSEHQVRVACQWLSDRGELNSYKIARTCMFYCVEVAHAD